VQRSGALDSRHQALQRAVQMGKATRGGLGGLGSVDGMGRVTSRGQQETSGSMDSMGSMGSMAEFDSVLGAICTALLDRIDGGGQVVWLGRGKRAVQTFNSQGASGGR
jgi:hypothetical protein